MPRLPCEALGLGWECTVGASRPVVLVADDDPSVCDLLKEVLEEEGYAVTCVRSGSAALARIEADSLDLALLDWRLPGLTGPEICQRARAAARRLPIVVTSAAGDPAGTEALRAGA